MIKSGKGVVTVSSDKKSPARIYSPVTLTELANYLVRYSSADRKLSINEIAVGLTCISDNFDDDHDNSRKSDEEKYRETDEILMDQMKYDKYQTNEAVKKQVRRLLDKYVNKHIMFGTYIRKSCKKHVSDSNAQVYYAETLFNEAQINILRNSISVYSYAEAKETAELVSKLNKLTNLYNREEYDPNLVSAIKYPGTYYRNLSEITKAFSQVKTMPKNAVLTKEQQEMNFKDYDEMYSKKVNKIRFKYCAYDENKQLAVRPAGGKKIRTVNPVKLMWANGYYYLVTYSIGKDNKPRYINYRVDRMINVKHTDEPAELPDSFSPDEYKYKNPVMYSSAVKCDEILIRCKKSVINNALDTFGFNIEIERTDTEDEVLIRLSDISPEGVKMWALEYGYGAEIISPDSLREDIAASVKKLAEMYIR